MLRWTGTQIGVSRKPDVRESEKNLRMVRGTPHSPELLEEKPFFIVGSGRSGTTLLRTILGAHSELAVTPETHYMKRAYREGAAENDEPEDFAAFWREFVEWRRFKDVKVDPTSVLRLVDRAGRRDFRTVFAAVLRAYGQAMGKRRVGEKTPGHYRYLDKIFSWFPEAKIVVVRRDPRDVVASHLRSPWVTEQIAPGRLAAPLVRRLRLFHVAERALLWRQAYGTFLAGASEDPRMHVVVYEQLVRQPAQEVAGICAFLEEQYEPSMLHSREGHTPSSDRNGFWNDWVDQHHKKASAPLTTASVGRWRNALSQTETEVIESICGRTMEHYGYEPQMPRRPQRLLGPALLQLDTLEGWIRTRRLR